MDKGPEYQVGDKVWLTRIDPQTKIAAVKTHRPSQKLEDKKFRPYTITDRYTHVYRLKLPPTMKIHPVFHESRLSPYQADTLGRTIKAPPPTITDQGEEYEVEAILKFRWTKHTPRHFQYLVSWKGYDGSHNSWESEANVQNAQEKLQEFHKKYPNEPRPDQQA